jgi:hypothetical protein
VLGLNAGECRKSIRSNLNLSSHLNPSRIKSTARFFRLFFFIRPVFLARIRMNGRMEVKRVARCLTKEVIMQAFSSLGTLDRSAPDLNIRSRESVAWHNL